MPKKSKPQLTVLPANPRGSTKVPKPQVRTVTGGPFSQRATKAQVGLSIPGVKTR